MFYHSLTRFTVMITYSSLTVWFSSPTPKKTYNGKRRLPIAVIIDHIAFFRGCSSWERSSVGGNAATSCRWWICRIRRWEGRKWSWGWIEQHAEVLHGRCSRTEDDANSCACDESLVHRIRHYASRFWQSLPIQIRRQRRSLNIDTDYHPWK